MRAFQRTRISNQQTLPQRGDVRDFRQTGLWHLLSLSASTSSTEISTLLDSWATRLATPVLAALPFVYFALLYRMMNSF